MTFKTLTELANFYGTDKGTIGPNPDWEPHNYTDIYEAYLARRRQSAIAILEIGLGVTGPQWETTMVQGRNTGGASVKMWYDYFPKAQIYGIDVNPCPYLDNDRIRTFVADQGNPKDLQAFLQVTHGIEFDVIIDDGSHRPDHQQIALGFFFKRLKGGGLYFIEDLLANGLGDRMSSRHANDSVRNTRSMLKHFQQTGEFLEPNALIDADYLKKQIAYFCFHAPKPVMVDATARYPADTEQICAITKKPAPQKPSIFSLITSRML